MSVRADSFHRRVQRYGWDRAVEDYARYWEPVLLHCSERAVAAVAPRPGERALDVACGDGAATFMLAEAVGSSGSVTGVDISERMVQAGRERAAAAGLRNVTFARMDAEQLHLPSGSQELATCVLGLMFPANPGAAISELFRVLRPGGRCAAVVWGRRSACGWRELFPIIDARVQSQVCPMFFSLGGPDVLADALRRAGFEDVHDERWQEALRFDSAEAACAAALAGGAAALAYSRFDEHTRQEVEAEYLASIEPYRQGARYEVPGEFVLAFGRKG
jgi:ubiquinone/menaquinone biosynthesis C-methylase UbiE